MALFLFLFLFCSKNDVIKVGSGFPDFPILFTGIRRVEDFFLTKKGGEEK